MRLSTKSTYGLRAMLNIALKYDKSTVSIADISKREGISATYLEQLLNRLRRDGLVKSLRGPNGGYILARGPDYITVRDVVKTLEGEISPVHCISTHIGSKNLCKRKKNCVPQTVWMKLARSISDCLGSITLQDLCRDAKKARG